MSIRGRGTLVVNPSSNPFFQTASQTIGADPYRKSDWERNRDEKNKRTEASSNKTFAFQFTRESDTIGSVPPHNDEPPIVNTQLDIPSSQVNNVTITDGHLVKLSAESVLSNYEHETKKEHPCYITTANTYGRKPPSIATVVTERHLRQQDFSRSFGNVKPRNSSMNTALTRSTIHSSLDPMFL